MKKVIIATPLDPHGQTSLEVGLQWAKDLKLAVDVVHADKLADLDALDTVFAHLNIEIHQKYLDNIIQANNEALAKQVKQIESDYDQLKFESKAGEPVDVIVSESNTDNVVLTVIGQRQDKTWAEQFMGSVSEGVLHRNPKSVLVVKNSQALKPKKIMVAYDFSQLCEAAVEWAEKLSAVYNSQVHLVNVVPCYYEGYHVAHTMHSSFNAAIEGMIQDSVEKIHEKLEARVQGIKTNHPVELETILDKEGSISEKLIKYADDNEIDLIISGSHQRGKVAELFLGSVSNKLLKKSKASVLIAK